MAIWAFDFDGTLCEDRFPEIGPAKIQAIEKEKSIKAEGNIIILWTCRVKDQLAAAVEFCRGYGLEFDYVNENVPENIEKYGNDCRKVYANHYVDDRAQSIEEYIKADYVHKIATEYGYEPQSRQLIEECAELIQAVNKDWRLNQKTAAEQSAALNEDLEKSAFHVLEELADVSIMVMQIAYLRAAESDGELDAEIMRKLQRQIQRIERKRGGGNGADK